MPAAAPSCMLVRLACKLPSSMDRPIARLLKSSCPSPRTASFAKSLESRTCSGFCRPKIPALLCPSSFHRVQILRQHLWWLQMEPFGEPYPSRTLGNPTLQGTLDGKDPSLDLGMVRENPKEEFACEDPESLIILGGPSIATSSCLPSSHLLTALNLYSFWSSGVTVLPARSCEPAASRGTERERERYDIYIYIYIEGERRLGEGGRQYQQQNREGEGR